MTQPQRRTEAYLCRLLCQEFTDAVEVIFSPGKLQTKLVLLVNPLPYSTFLAGMDSSSLILGSGNAAANNSG